MIHINITWFKKKIVTMIGKKADVYPAALLEIVFPILYDLIHNFMN